MTPNMHNAPSSSSMNMIRSSLSLPLMGLSWQVQMQVVARYAPIKLSPPTMARNEMYRQEAKPRAGDIDLSNQQYAETNTPAISPRRENVLTQKTRSGFSKHSAVAV